MYGVGSEKLRFLQSTCKYPVIFVFLQSNKKIWNYLIEELTVKNCCLIKVYTYLEKIF